MLELPPSLDRTKHSLEDEIAYARALTPEQRIEMLALVCQAAAHVLEVNPQRERIMAMRDP